MNLLSKYLEIIGFVGPVKADLKTLTELNRLHTLKFPFENITPFVYREVILETEIIHQKFITDGRGGYCFEQNRLFASMLEAIGFDIKTMGARVLWNQSEDLITRRSHMFLIVTIDQVEYLVDVGFGGMTLTTPMRFVIDLEQATTHEYFRISKMGVDYKLQAKVIDEWKTLYRFDLQVQYPIDYEVANFYLYTHPSSIFRNTLIAAMPVTHGRFVLNNRVLTFYPLNGLPEKRILADSREVRDVLEKIFHLKVPADDFLDQKIDQLV
jgi:N-hydroxyarylamine O-acetyltransferase